jgi:tryptophan-rich sensory protein
MDAGFSPGTWCVLSMLNCLKLKTVFDGKMTDEAVESTTIGEIDRDDVVGAGIAVVIVNVVGAVPAILGGPSTEWFGSVAKPSLFPPTWTFGVVWTILFTLLGVATYVVYSRGSDRRKVKVALGLFVVQMAFNVAWTPAFFAFQSIGLAFGIIVGLFVLVLATTWAFARVDRRAAALLVPYIVWVGFAAVLNYQFLQLN